ncbi:MAG: winged helix-turn-helix transcriptional regulator [Candidatus Helarchaeota archaeon]|nr:winged helix-turn-helix transcriptional regulator [Candidatus Helarchaeota archaeon]
MVRKNYRVMSDEDLEAWRKRVLEKDAQRNPLDEHRRALRAMQNPVRRTIITMLKEKALSTDELAKNLDLDKKTLQYHLQFLKDVFFITIEGNIVDLTPPGVAYTRKVLE